MPGLPPGVNWDGLAHNASARYILPNPQLDGCRGFAEKEFAMSGAYPPIVSCSALTTSNRLHLIGYYLVLIAAAVCESCATTIQTRCKLRSP